MRELLTIDPASIEPPFEQVRLQLTALIETGRLAPGERLPAVRRLAADLDLAAGTVARAYKELEAAGLVTTARGAGTRVAARPEAVSAEGLVRLERAADAFLDRAVELGATPEQAAQALERVTRRRGSAT